MSDEVNSEINEVEVSQEFLDKINAAIDDTSKPIKWNTGPDKMIKKSDAIKRTRQVQFLQALAECGTITKACKHVGISAATELKWRASDDKWYTDRFKETMSAYRDKIEDEIHDRAINGVQVPIIGKVQTEFGPEDRIIGEKTVKSDLLLMFHAKRHIPEYKDKYTPTPENSRQDETVSPLTRIRVQLDVMQQRYEGKDHPASEVIDVTPERPKLTDGSED